MPFKPYEDGAVDRFHQPIKQTNENLEQKIECNLAGGFGPFSS